MHESQVTMLIYWLKQLRNDIDIYLALLVKELKLLRDTSVNLYDQCIKKQFILRVMLFGTINNILAYDYLSGHTIKRNHVCLICEDDANIT